MSSLMDKNQGDVIVAFTASWRYFAVGAILALLGQFALLLHDSISPFSLAVSVGLFFASQYFIFRLWLDHHFFTLIYRQGDIQAFDEALGLLFPQSSSNQNRKNRSMESRWEGTRKLFQRASYCVVLLWGWLFFSLIF
ncbi:hypothetical protein [Providencia alcalifaciens]|uniref:hypothetical protein n=1 Tax=Providencia alcalifaciens TaxID=126385 RepID=UPI002B061CA4|nr:hypothetical protein [Providencia alcalifaciens]